VAARRTPASNGRTGRSTRQRTKAAGRRSNDPLKSLDKDQFRYIYLTMRRIRRFEESAEEAYRAAKMRGALHFYIGEEASATGVCAALERNDYITSTHRGHGHCIAKGARLDKMLAELYGRSTGYCGGKGGSMHIADLDLGNLGANGIVGAGIPIAVGAGMTAKFQKTDKVVVCFFGDAAGPTGAFHEGVNMAAVFNLPVVFWCENNQYGMATRADFANAGGNVVRKAPGYDIPGEEVDGNDVFAVYEVAKRAIDRARAGKGPSLIEARTYRFKGHTILDQKGYRAQDEIERWMRADPIERFLSVVSKAKALTAEELSEIDAEVEREVQHALEFAEASPWPALETLEQDVYA
jgi:TPP-dependent pyruvate/acetoin dehydrogenase alpha subunit